MNTSHEHAHLLALLALFLPAVLYPADPNQTRSPVLSFTTDAGRLGFRIDPLDLDLFDHIDRASETAPSTVGEDTSKMTVRQRIRRLVTAARAEHLAITRLIDLAESLGLDPEVLDDDVIDIHCNDASEMNNNGFGESIPYLYRALGETELEQRLLGANGPGEAA
ncbi:hypothetical protein [Nocardia brasiliensis]|uniref:hypothetical protein n=1 Tax=Nocardia brasiliensis TaxID=37326 RepID=UPI0024588858|nr:hypothetical protein [Nocardia brasiliensis]